MMRAIRLAGAYRPRLLLITALSTAPAVANQQFHPWTTVW